MTHVKVGSQEFTTIWVKSCHIIYRWSSVTKSFQLVVKLSMSCSKSQKHLKTPNCLHFLLHSVGGNVFLQVIKNQNNVPGLFLYFQRKVLTLSTICFVHVFVKINSRLFSIRETNKYVIGRY